MVLTTFQTLFWSVMCFLLFSQTDKLELCMLSMNMKDDCVFLIKRILFVLKSQAFL